MSVDTVQQAAAGALDEGATNDQLGPELVIHAHDGATGTKGILVVDCSVLGPVGGGTRMAPDLDEREVRQLARAMTYKFAFLGLPRGGSKAGIVADPAMPAERKSACLRAFGRQLRALMRNKDVALGPDMGITVDDVARIYDGAGVPQLRSGLFTQMVDGDPAGYHFTGRGVVNTAAAACRAAGLSFAGSTMAIEGFGQVGVGTARAAVRQGSKVVAITTMNGGIFCDAGLDVPLLLELRRRHGDECVRHYTKPFEPLAPQELYGLPVDILVPGARPWVIHERNASVVRAKVVASAGNITMTTAAQKMLTARGILCVPDFVANAGGMLASLFDILGGTVDQAFRAIDRMMTAAAEQAIQEAIRRNETVQTVAIERARRLVEERLGRPRPTFDQVVPELRAMLGLS